MIVVSDASAIIALSIIGRLEILKELFHDLVIPSAVYTEIVIHGSQRLGAEEIENSDWITVRSVQDNSIAQFKIIIRIKPIKHPPYVKGAKKYSYIFWPPWPPSLEPLIIHEFNNSPINLTMSH